MCTVVTVMGKQCWSQAVLESGSWEHSLLQTSALVNNIKCGRYFFIVIVCSIVSTDARRVTSMLKMTIKLLYFVTLFYF